MDNLSNARMLKPCAHCGSEMVRVSRIVDLNTPCWFVECINCGIQTQRFPETFDGEEPVNHTSNVNLHNVLDAMNIAIDCAVESWNCRVHRANKRNKLVSIYENCITDEKNTYERDNEGNG